MNLSVPFGKRSLLFVLFIFVQVVPGRPGIRLCAQETGVPDGAPAARDRMEKSLKRQMNSAAAMQMSVSARQQAVKSRNEQGFFTLPPPAPVARSWSPAPNNPAHYKDADDDNDDRNEDSAGSHENRGEEPQAAEQPAGKPPVTTPRETYRPSNETRIEIPWKPPLPVSASVAAPVQVGGLTDRVGVTGGLSLEEILQQQLDSASQIKPVGKPSVPFRDSLGAGAVDYLRQMLNFSFDGLLLQGSSGAP